VGVSIIGCGDYEALMRHRAETNGCPTDSAEFQRRFPPALATLLQRYDPVQRADALAATKLRFVGAGADMLVPPACNVRLLERLRAAGAAAVDEVIVPDAPHTLHPAMIEYTAEWFRRHVSDAPARL